MNTKIPLQYSELGRIIKKILHTKIGAWIGFISGIAGFNRIDSHIIRANGTMEKLAPTYNARVNKGADLCASLLTGAAQNSISSPLPPKYIALTPTLVSIDKTDTTLSGETSATGLERAVGTIAGYTGPSTLDGACLYTVSKTFTNTSGGPVTIQTAAIFDAASTGNMFVEAQLSSSAILANNDSLAITWTINL